MYRVNVVPTKDANWGEWVQSFNSLKDAEEFAKVKADMPDVLETKVLDGSKSHK